MATRTITTRLAVDGETAFKRAMTNVNAELRTLRSELALADAEFKGQANSLEYLSKKQDILNRQYDTQRATVEALKKAVEDATAAYGEGDKRTQDYQRQLNRAQVELINLNEALQQNERYLDEARRSTDGTADSIDELGNEVEDTDDALEDAGGSALKFGDILKAHLASGVILGALKKLASAVWDFAKNAVEAGKAFDKAMSQVAATMGVPVRQIKELRDFAKEMGATTAFSAVQAAEGLNVLAMAGLSARDQMAALPEVLNLAAAGNLSLESSAAYVTGTIKGFKDEMSNAQQYTDLIAKGATLANTSVTGLGDALSRSAATANGYKQSADSVTLSLLRLAEQNLEGEAASTALNRAMADLYTPTAAAKQVLDELGFSAYSEAGAARDFNEVVDALNQSLAGMTDSQRNANLAAIFTTQGLNAFNKMISASPEKLDAFRAGLDSAFGSSAQQAETQLDNLAGDMTMLDSAMEGLKIKISDGLEPILRGLAQAATAVVSALAELGDIKNSPDLLVSGTNELLDSLEKSASAYVDSSAAIEDQAEKIRTMISTLEDLSGMTLRTSAQDQALLDIISQLNQAIPNLNLAYNAETGSLNMTTEAVRALAGAEAERQGQANDVARMIELEQERAQIVNDLAAAEAQLAAAQERRAGLTGIFSKEISEADKSVTLAARSVERLQKELNSAENTLTFFERKYGEVETAVETATDVIEDNAQSAEDLTVAYEEAQQGTEALTGAADLLKTALDEQAESGNVSLDTALKIIDAGYAAALSIDTETGAVTLNKEEYVRLTRAKLDDQIASLESQRQSIQSANNLNIEAAAAEHAGSAYWEAAASKAAMNSGGDTSALEAQIASLKRLRDSIGDYTGKVATASRATSSAAKTAEKVKTQAEQDLESYKTMTAELEHLRAMDAVSERDYYDALARYRDQFLTDDANVDEYRKVTEKIYDYDKSLGEKEAKLWAEQTETMIDELKERFQAVLKEQEQMEEKLAGYGDLFSIDRETGAMTVEDLQKQIDAENAYFDNLMKLRERGLSDSLLDEVLGMDVDSATQYAGQLLSMTDKEWDNYNELWDTKQRRAAEIAEEFFKDELDSIETDYNKELGNAFSTLEKTARESGSDVAKGLIEGLQDQEGVLYAQAEQMVRNVSAILASAGAGMASTFSPDNLRQPAAATAQDVRGAASNIVNGMGTMMTGAGGGDLTVPLIVNGREIATATLPDFRFVNRANPEVRDDR